MFRRRHKPDYADIARLEQELGIGSPVPIPSPPPEARTLAIVPSLPDETPVLRPDPKPPIETLAEYVSKRRGEKYRLNSVGQVYASSASYSAIVGPIAYAPKGVVNLRTIYGPNDKPLYDTPAHDPPAS